MPTPCGAWPATTSSPAVAAATCLKGGAGNDRFVYTALSDSAVSGLGKDGRSRDFSTGDKIDLSAIDADGNAANGDTAFSFGTGDYTRHAGELRVVTAGEIQVVYVDVNGDKASDFAINVTSDHPLTAADFLLLTRSGAAAHPLSSAATGQRGRDADDLFRGPPAAARQGRADRRPFHPGGGEAGAGRDHPGPDQGRRPGRNSGAGALRHRPDRPGARPRLHPLPGDRLGRVEGPSMARSTRCRPTGRCATCARSSPARSTASSATTPATAARRSPPAPGARR